ncbi:uncharacterized protein LOC119600009 [Lucilia sericata]|uniref:uncharacterized protein LOC119600009 n=1 Tax=Lucilia sericata TaxID=13632 RepID=UPI0018A80FAF|nr:uncharacterized protein LOC119600009 [Lucilia sericata]
MQSIETLYNKDHNKTENQKSSRLKKLKPEVALELCKHRPSYEYVKAIAIEHLEKSLNDQLQLLISVDKCDYNDMDKLSKNIFSWSKKDFLERRALENCVWIDVFKKHTNRDCLEKFKIKTDLREMLNLLNLLFKGDSEISICKTLREAENNFNIFVILQEENKKLTEELQDYDFRYKARLFNRRQTKQQLILWDLEATMLNAQTWGPIKMRYQINWYQYLTEQAEVQKTLKDNAIQHKIDQYKFKMLIEKMSADNISDVYYTLAEQHKHDLDALQNRFDSELDKIDNEISYVRLQIAKLIEQQRILSEQIEEFHEQIRKRLEKEEYERQQQELERLRLEEEIRLNKLKEEKSRKKKSGLKAKASAKV